MPGNPPEDAPFPSTSLFCIVHITSWPAVAVEETDLPISWSPVWLPHPSSHHPVAVAMAVAALIEVPGFQHWKGRFRRRPLGQEGLTHEMG